MNGEPTPLRRELIVFFGVLLAGALLIATPALALLLPRFDRPGQVIGLVVALVVLDLLVVAISGRWFIQARLVTPVERMVEDVRRLAAGDEAHRIGPVSAAELQDIRTSVNAMADRLVEKQRVLVENVASLDRTNSELVAARDEVIRTARLASVGTLAAGIAHEVGNPLAALIALTDLPRPRAGGQVRGGPGTPRLHPGRGGADRPDRPDSPGIRPGTGDALRSHRRGHRRGAGPGADRDPTVHGGGDGGLAGSGPGAAGGAR